MLRYSLVKFSPSSLLTSFCSSHGGFVIPSKPLALMSSKNMDNIMPLKPLTFMLSNYMPCSTEVAHEDSRKTNLSYLERFKRNLRALIPKSQKIRRSSEKLYQHCVDDIDYNVFFKYTQLPDTFQSWMQVTHLHVWLCSSRLSIDGRGRVVRNTMTSMMWTDMEHRMKQIARFTTSTKKEVMKNAHGQLAASLIAYDEGVIGDDTVLAGAVWRSLFCFQCTDPRLIEIVVLYIRKQLSHLYLQQTDDMMYHGKVSFLPFEECIKL